MKRYITDGINLRIERSRRKDYQIFKPNNKREEMLFGEKYENLHWEYLPFGEFIMMYSEKKDIYIPARITEFKKNEELNDLGEELADVLFVLLCLANQTGIDLEKSFEKKLKKKSQRDKT